MRYALLDAAEHRNGKQRIPLIISIGSAVCVNDITSEELQVWLDGCPVWHCFSDMLLSLGPLYVCCSYFRTQVACKELWSYENRT